MEKISLLLLECFIPEHIHDGLDDEDVLGSLIDHVAVGQVNRVCGIEAGSLDKGGQVAVDRSRLT